MEVKFLQGSPKYEYVIAGDTPPRLNLIGPGRVTSDPLWEALIPHMLIVQTNQIYIYMLLCLCGSPRLSSNGAPRVLIAAIAISPVADATDKATLAQGHYKRTHFYRN